MGGGAWGGGAVGGGAVGAGWIGSSGAGTGAGATGTSFATATVSTCAPIDAIDMDAGAASACGSGSAMGVGTAVTGSELSPRRARARPSPRRPASRSWDLREVPVEGEMRWCVERSAHRTLVSGTGHWCEGAIGDEESRQNVRADRPSQRARRDGSGASLASERRGPASIRSIQAVPRAIAPR
jgi:hypothetical protein